MPAADEEFPKDPPKTQLQLEKAMANIEQKQRSNLEKSIEAVSKMGASGASTSISPKAVVALKAITKKMSERQGQHAHAFDVSNRLSTFFKI